MQILGPRSLNRSLNRNLLGKGLFDSASLDLRFAVNKTLDPRVTFTRASTGTYVGGDGLIKTAASGAPRFDHNPTTGESLGLLVEEARTNLVLRSEEFDNASWTKIGTTVTPDVSQSPTGNTTADLVEVVTSGGSKSVLCNIASLTASSNYTLSFYAKAGASSTVVAGLFTVAFLGQYAFTLTGAGSVSTGVAGVSASITLAGNGWYRCQLTATTTGTSVTVLIYPNSTTNVIGNSVYLWGAQLEAGTFATSYIPTTSSTATRAADVASMTGTNFSSWYNVPEGSVFANYRCFANTAYPDVFNISDGTNANRQQQFIDGSNGFTTFREVVSSTQQGITSQVSTINSEIKSVGAYSSIGLVLTLNGLNPSTNANATHPTGLNKLSIGSSGVGITNYINGTIKRLTYWPIRLPNATLQAITTS
jgi:hypothetical protein